MPKRMDSELKSGAITQSHRMAAMAHPARGRASCRLWKVKSQSNRLEIRIITSCSVTGQSSWGCISKAQLSSIAGSKSLTS